MIIYLDVNDSILGSFTFLYNYKHYGKSFDYAPTVTKVDSTDIMNLSILKNIGFSVVSFNVSNLLDENYQRPYGYSQNGRLFNLRFRINY